MAFVDSNSSRADVLAALADNAAWSALRSVPMAQAYVVAATVWLDIHAFDKSVKGPSELDDTQRNKGIENRRAEAQRFISNAGRGSEVIRFSVSNFRD